MKLTLFLMGAALTLWPVATAHEGCQHDHAEHAHAHAEHADHDEDEHEQHEHHHADGESCCDHDHAHEGHTHAEGETCDHDHAHEGHTHAEGETCCGHEHTDHDEHHHADGESCDHDHAHEGHTHADGETCCGHDHHAHDSAPVIVKVDARSRHALQMQTETVADGRGRLAHSMYGTLTVPEHATETYALPCAGFITLAVKSAQQVKAGDVLYTLVSPELNDRWLEQQKAEAAESRAKDELAVLQERRAKLAAIGVANSELDSQLHFKQAELRQLAQERTSGAARLQMMLRGGELETSADGVQVLTVRSHGAGTVRNVGVTQGSWGEQGAPVIVMSHPEAMEVRGELYSGSIPAFDSVRATLTSGREHAEMEGTWRLSEQADAEKQTRTLFFTPAELPAGTRPGQLCRLDLYEQGDADTASIPDSAIVRVGLDDMVFVEVSEGTYAAVKVHAGESRRGMTPVDGLPHAAKIVVKGGQELRQLLPTAAAAAKKPGHFHADGSFHEGEH